MRSGGKVGADSPGRILNGRLIACAVAAALTWSGASGAAQADAAAPTVTTLDEVLVTGERPGPGMWRVSRNGHELWILATLAPLPKKMTWRSTAVEARIGASQAVLAPPEVSAGIGFLTGVTLLPALFRAKKSPDGQTLERILPHETYIRWLALRVKFLGRSDDEQLRPMLAALDLYLHALDASGLSSDDSVWKVVEGEARERRVSIVPVVATLTLDDPKAAIRQLGEISRDAEVSCLEKTLARLETDLQPMRQRANLWALGDVAGLRALLYPDERTACLDAVFSVPQLREQMQRAHAKLLDTWLAVAAGSIEQHQSTVAVLPITELLESGGYLDRLRALGFTIQEP